MKKIFATVFVLGLSYGSLFAQSEIDALKLSKTDLNGSARYMSMGGAFGALGGDISVLGNNPAGIGVYRSSEFVGTLNVSNTSTSTTWNGSGVDASNLKFNFNNFGYVGTFKTAQEGLVNFNFGLSFNRLKNFNRDYKTPVMNSPVSLSGYVSAFTNNYDKEHGILEDNLDITNTYSGYDSKPWISVLGYTGILMNPQATINNYFYDPIGTLSSINTLKVSERGYMDEYNISFGGNIYDVLYFGGTIGITDLNYTYSSVYNEDLGGNNNYNLYNYREIKGSGINLKAGVILRPTDFLRFGLALHTPTFTKLNDNFNADLKWNDGTTTDNKSTPFGYTEYSHQSPFKLQASTALVLGKTAIVSFEYEYIDYARMKMRDPDGIGWIVNDYIKEDMKAVNNIKVGGELRLTKQFSLRAGYANMSGMYKDDVLNQNNVLNQNVKIDLFGSTNPHYTLDRGTTYYTGGFGYRFGSYYTDLAVVLRNAKEDVYAFSPIKDLDNWLVPEKATLNTKSTQILFTLGYKF